MISYLQTDLFSTIKGCFTYMHNVGENHFDSFDAKCVVSLLIVAVYGVSWPKSPMAGRQNH